MGLFPDRLCPSCGKGFHSFNGQWTHCDVIQHDLDQTCQSLRRANDLVMKIINAYRSRGECVAELMEAVYEFGMSVRHDEFRWLDEELERLNAKREQKK